MACVSVGYIKNNFVINPTASESRMSSVRLLVTGTCTGVLGLLGECELVSNDIVVGAVEAAHSSIQHICNGLVHLRDARDRCSAMGAHASSSSSSASASALDSQKLFSQIEEVSLV